MKSGFFGLTEDLNELGLADAKSSSNPACDCSI
jgi:hypothetical protein